MKRDLAIFKIDYDADSILEYIETIRVTFSRFLRWDWHSKNYDKYYNREDITVWDATDFKNQKEVISQILIMRNNQLKYLREHPLCISTR